MKLAALLFMSMASAVDEDDACAVESTCTIAISEELPFTPPVPGVWRSYVMQGQCGFHWAGEWTVFGPNGEAAQFWVYRRPWNVMCGPECAEAGGKGQYLHIPNDNPGGTYRIEVKSPTGGGWTEQCVEIPN